MYSTDMAFRWVWMSAHLSLLAALDSSENFDKPVPASNIVPIWSVSNPDWRTVTPREFGQLPEIYESKRRVEIESFNDDRNSINSQFYDLPFHCDAHPIGLCRSIGQIRPGEDSLENRPSQVHGKTMRRVRVDPREEGLRVLPCQMRQVRMDEPL
jgi:hypothetical protein